MLIHFVLFFSFIDYACSLNVFLVSVPDAGHLTPAFELIESMKNHNVLFLTG